MVVKYPARHSLNSISSSTWVQIMMMHDDAYDDDDKCVKLQLTPLSKDLQVFN